MNEDEVQSKRRQNEEAATERRAGLLGLLYLDTRDFEQTMPLVRHVLTKKEMHENFMIPLQVGEGSTPYQFMVTSQTPRHIIEEMQKQYEDEGLRVEFYLISNSAYQVFMLRHDPPQEIHYDDIEIASEGDSETIQQVSQTLNSVATDKVFDYLLDQADKLGASDIHIENLRHSIRIRMRVDGILHPVAEINRDRYRIFMGELSSRANVSTASMRPQSGHMQKDITRDGATHLLNIRVEMVPTMYGQDAVLRLFNFDESLLNRKIITLEDPIEYGLTGISQIPIATGQGGSFAEGLRSVLRLDPDVVMVGEIRDPDTARTAIQASITGHLVLSSFHANSSSAAFSRMIDMIGINPVFSSSVRLVIAQRLLRKLDENKEAYKPDVQTVKFIKDALDNLELTDYNLDDMTLWKPKPSHEHPFGYSGRTAVMEQLIVDEPIQKFIRGEVMPDTNAIEKTAREGGMLTLQQKGILAALRGDTTIEEVARVI